MSKPTLTSQLISNSFGWQTVSKARTLIERSAVLDWGFDISGTKMLGRVQEPGRSNPYRVEVLFAAPDETGNRWLTGQCSCPAVRDCAHAAAMALMAADDRGMGGADSKLIADSDFDGGYPGPGTEAGQGEDPPFAAYWLKHLDASLGGGAATSEVEESVVYILGFDRWSHENNLQIEPRIARQLKGGGFGSNRAYNWRQLANSKARFVQVSDQAIAKLWVSCSPSDAQISPGRPLLPPYDGDVLDLLLARIINTGRAYFDGKLDLKLKPGAPKDGQVEWVVHEDSRQTPQVVLCQANAVIKVLQSSSYWYVDTSNGEAGPLKLPYERETVQTLLAAPRVGPKDAALIHRILSEKEQGLPLPQLDISEEVRNDHPRIRLSLKYEKFKHKRLVSNGSEQKYIDGDNIAMLTFDYGFDSTKFSQDWESHRWSDGKRFIVTRRDIHFEKAIHDKLLSLSFVQSSALKLPPTQSCWRTRNYGADAWLKFVQESVPVLKQEDWQIETDSTFQYQVVEADGEWLVDIDESADFWFALDLGIVVDGERLSLLPVITEAIRAADIDLSLSSLDKLNVGGKFYAGLPDGRLIALPFERVKAMISCLAEILGSNNLSPDGRLGISIPQVTALASLNQDSNYNWQDAQSTCLLAEQMGKFDILREIDEPAALHAVLRPYQKEGLGWLDFISTFSLGGILADDMGLGKTVQTLAHIARAKEQGKLENCPCLVLCPTSVLPNWLLEIQRLTPVLTVVPLHGGDRAGRFDLVQSADIVVSTYPLLIRDAAFLTSIKWHCVILDEAQAIKNSNTQAAQAVLQLDSKYRLCLTGTPIENHLGELWSQFNFLMPGLLGTKAAFDRVFRTPIEKGNSAEKSEKLELLLSRVNPFLLRRTKGQVAKDLPPKVEMVKYVEMEGRQRDLYETVRLSMHKRVLEEVKKKGLASCGLIVLDALMKLRQTCCHPGLVKLEAAEGIEGSAKLQYLMGMLDELLEEKRQILLFSQFTSMLDLIALELTARGIAFVQLRGDTKDRATPVREFQNGQVPLFLISLKAGGTGLNLTAADTVIHFDPWWNPAVEDQATDRAHRIGQDKPVFVYRLIASGTIEERMMELQKDKRAVAESILGSSDDSGNGNSASRPQIDEATLAALFAPLPT